MTAFVPKGTSGAGTGTSAHSSLTGLQGGGAGQYYHLTAAEYASLSGLTSVSHYEPVLASVNGNLDVTYIAGTSLVPDFLLSSTGDIIMGIGA